MEEPCESSETGSSSTCREAANHRRTGASTAARHGEPI
nr:MAG TPA: hypothetical protein [Caudoviricetes sp.]